jgi:hypothetical protein
MRLRIAAQDLMRRPAEFEKKSSYGDDGDSEEEEEESNVGKLPPLDSEDET